MFFALELQEFRVCFLSQGQGLIKPSHLLIRGRKIALCDDNGFFWCADAPPHS
jgi:hypothetical protein